MFSFFEKTKIVSLFIVAFFLIVFFSVSARAEAYTIVDANTVSATYSDNDNGHCTFFSNVTLNKSVFAPGEAVVITEKSSVTTTPGFSSPGNCGSWLPSLFSLMAGPDNKNSSPATEASVGEVWTDYYPQTLSVPPSRLPGSLTINAPTTPGTYYIHTAHFVFVFGGFPGSSFQAYTIVGYLNIPFVVEDPAQRSCDARLAIKNGLCLQQINPNPSEGGSSGQWDCKAYYTDDTVAIPFTGNFDLAYQPFLNRVCAPGNWSWDRPAGQSYNYFTCTVPRSFTPPLNICRDNWVQPSCTGAPQPVKAGETVRWTASALSGTAPYTFTWNGGSASVSGTGSTKDKVYSSAGTYTTTVSVKDFKGNVGGSSEACAVIVDPPPPVGPPKVKISATSNPANSIPIPTVDYNTASSLTWSETTGFATSCTGTGFTATGTTGESGISTGNLTSSQTYKITCSNTSGSSSASVAVGVRPQKPTPTVTTGGNCSGEFDISWTADPLAISYTLMVDGYPVAPRVTSPYRYFGGSNATHAFQVIASNYFGSAASAVKSATNSCTSTLSAPTVLTATFPCEAGQGKIQVWMQSASTGATGYRLYRGDTSGFAVNSTSLIKDYTPGGTPPPISSPETPPANAFFDQGLSLGQPYFYKWVSYNSQTNSSASTAVSGTASLKCPDLIVASIIPPTSIGLPFGTVLSGSGSQTISAVIKNQGEATDPTVPFKNRVWTSDIVLRNPFNNFAQNDQPITGGLLSNATRFITSGPWTIPYVATATNVPVKVCADQPPEVGVIDERYTDGTKAENNNCLELPIRIVPQITATLECANQKTGIYKPSYCILDYKDALNLRWTVTGSPSRCDASYNTDWNGNKTTSSFQPPNNPLLLSNLLDKFVYKYRLECTR